MYLFRLYSFSHKIAASQATIKPAKFLLSKDSCISTLVYVTVRAFPVAFFLCLCVCVGECSFTLLSFQRRLFYRLLFPLPSFFRRSE